MQRTNRTGRDGNRQPVTARAIAVPLAVQPPPLFTAISDWLHSRRRPAPRRVTADRKPRPATRPGWLPFYLF